MTELDLDRLDARTRETLRADQEQPAAAIRERLAGRLAASVGALALGTLPGAPPLSGNPGYFERLRGAARAHPLAFAGTFALGAAVGAAAHAVLPRDLPRAAYVDRVVPRSAPAAASAVGILSAATPNAPLSESPAAPVPALEVRPAASPRPMPSPSDSLAAQQALLDAARKALTSEDYAATLAALEAHAARYPKGALTEEREALFVKALVASGRFAEARQRGAEFAARFPRSLLLPSVHDSLATIP